MAIEKCLMADAKNAGADLSGSLHLFAHMDTDGDLVLAGDGEPVYGVITEGATEGNPVTVMVYGIAKVIAGGTVATGAVVASNASGQAVTATAGEVAAGIARTGGASGEVIEVLLTHPFNAAA